MLREESPAIVRWCRLLRPAAVADGGLVCRPGVGGNPGIPGLAHPVPALLLRGGVPPAHASLGIAPIHGGRFLAFHVGNYETDL